jgi:hypothetical protein
MHGPTGIFWANLTPFPLQTLVEYPDLDGIGLSLGDRVSNLNLTQQLDYAADVIIAGVQ